MRSEMIHMQCKTDDYRARSDAGQIYQIRRRPYAGNLTRCSMLVSARFLMASG